MATFLSGESHGQRSLAGHTPWGHKRVRLEWATKRQQPLANSLQETEALCPTNPQRTEFCHHMNLEMGPSPFEPGDKNTAPADSFWDRDAEEQLSHGWTPDLRNQMIITACCCKLLMCAAIENWQRSLAGYSPRGCKQSDTTERLLLNTQ